jgi:two-component system sensor histidine kinase HydH
MRTKTMRGKAHKTGFREDTLVFAFLAVLCLALVAVVLVALSGESRRSRLLLEYEAEETATALLMVSLGAGEIPDLQSLERRVLGFGLYRGDGSAIARGGSAPPELRLPERPLRQGSSRFPPAQFRFHRERGTVTLMRWVGRFPGPMGMSPRGVPGGPPQGVPPDMPGMMGRSMRGEGPQVLFLELQSAEHWTRSGFNHAARIAAPIIILGVIAGMGLLYRRNSLYRRRLADQEQLARLGEISRTLSHEIKNPLSAIRIQTAYLKKTLPAERHGELKVIEEEVARLGLLTDRVGDFLRDPRGEPELVDLDSFIRELKRRFDRPIEYLAPAEAAEAGVRLSVRFDSQRLRSVLENLIKNAMDNGEEGAASGPVEIALTASRSHVEIAVRDRGPGIPEQLLEKVFDPFYTTKTQGSGIGLSVSRRFVEAAGGRLLLSNRSGGGLEARVVLPRGPS